MKGGKMPKLARYAYGSILFIVLALIFLGQSLAQSDKTISRWGQLEDVPLIGDFDRDGSTDDIAIYRPSEISVYFDFDADESVDAVMRKDVGGKEDQFVVGDFDQDGYLNDIGTFKPFGRWYFGTFLYNPDNKTMTWLTSIPSMDWGLKGDLALAGDFDENGYADNIGIFRPSHRTWLFNYDFDEETDRTSGPWAVTGDMPITGDFDGDGDYSDLAVFRPSDRTWYFDNDSDGGNDWEYPEWGLTGGIPEAGDFDGDGVSDDIVIFRPLTGEWFFKFF
jgi:hypothetical protein